MINKSESVITSVFMSLVIIAGFIILKPYNYIGKYYQEMRDNFIKDEKPVEEKKEETNVTAKDEAEKKDIQQDMIENMDPDVAENSGRVLKGLNLKEIYLHSAGTLLNNGYVVRMYPYTKCSYELKQMKWLKEYTDKKGIQLLYYNKPTKYLQDSYVVNETGIPTYVNENADFFLKKLSSIGIRSIDFRDKIRTDNAFQYFYRTDHHETVPTGLEMASQIAEELNAHYGYDIDMNFFDSKWFETKLYKQAWLGEQGKKLGKAQTGLDDYTEMWPSYETSFTVKGRISVRRGEFKKALINEDYYSSENNQNVNTAESWHYSYQGNNGVIINNLINQDKKVLVLGDSYDAVVNAFLSLGVRELHSIVMRNFEGDLSQYIEKNDFDTVIVSYASQMIGGYDQKNANKTMFAFNPKIK